MEIVTLISSAVSIFSLLISTAVFYLNYTNRGDILKSKNEEANRRIVKADELAHQLELKLVDVNNDIQDIRDDVTNFKNDFSRHVGEHIKIRTQLEGSLYQLNKIESKLDKLLERS